MKKCVINLATKDSWYIKGQKRLLKSLEENGFDGDFHYWIGEESVGAPKHTKVPYGFKTHAFMKAKKMGYDLILWFDCSVYAVKPIEPIFDIIKSEGHYFESCGATLGRFCSDSCLDKLDITREDAFSITLFSAGMTGLNLKNERSCKFLEEWHEHSTNGVSFVGPWTNKNKKVSKDIRVVGHRHDQSVASAIAHKLNMKIDPPKYYQYWASEISPETICVLRPA